MDLRQKKNHMNFVGFYLVSSVFSSRTVRTKRTIHIHIGPRKILRVLCGYFEHQRTVQFENCVAEPLQTITAILPGSKWSSWLLRIVLQDSLSEVTKIYLPLKLRVSVDDITIFINRKNKELVKMAGKV